MLDDGMVQRLLNPLTGITAKCSYLPTRADIMKFVDAEASKYREAPDRSNLKPLSMADYHAHRTGNYSHKFRPFPALWKAFEGDPEAYRRLDSSLPFEQIDSAAKTLATRSKVEARSIIMRELTMQGRWQPPKAPFDISDFKDRQAPQHMDAAS